MSKTFTHNGVFEPDFDVSKDITGEEYIGFKTYIELPKGEARIGQSLLILLAKSLSTSKCYCELSVEKDGYYTPITHEVAITEPAFQRLTGLVIIDNGNKDNTPALPYGNVIEKGYYYE